MQIYDTKTKQMRDMTPEEEYTAEHLPDPENMPPTDEEILSILLGGEK